MATHRYFSTTSWSGSTGNGYAGYDRSHRVTPTGTEGFAVSAAPAFLGDATLANPEQLVLAAASSCQLLSFLAVAARSRVDIVDYVDEATAIMPEGEHPVRITQITLRPRITARGAEPTKVERLVRMAHDQCYVANSLTASISVEPFIEVIP